MQQTGPDQTKSTQYLWTGPDQIHTVFMDWTRPNPHSIYGLDQTKSTQYLWTGPDHIHTLLCETNPTQSFKYMRQVHVHACYVLTYQLHLTCATSQWRCRTACVLLFCQVKKWKRSA